MQRALHNTLRTENCTENWDNELILPLFKNITTLAQLHQFTQGCECTTEEKSHNSIGHGTQVSPETRANVVDDVNVSCMAGTLIDLNTIRKKDDAKSCRTLKGHFARTSNDAENIAEVAKSAGPETTKVKGRWTEGQRKNEELRIALGRNGRQSLKDPNGIVGRGTTGHGYQRVCKQKTEEKVAMLPSRMGVALIQPDLKARKASRLRGRVITLSPFTVCRERSRTWK